MREKSIRCRDSVGSSNAEQNGYIYNTRSNIWHLSMYKAPNSCACMLLILFVSRSFWLVLFIFYARDAAFGRYNCFTIAVAVAVAIPTNLFSGGNFARATRTNTNDFVHFFFSSFFSFHALSLSSFFLPSEL